MTFIKITIAAVCTLMLGGCVLGVLTAVSTLMEQVQIRKIDSPELTRPRTTSPGIELIDRKITEAAARHPGIFKRSNDLTIRRSFSYEAGFKYGPGFIKFAAKKIRNTRFGTIFESTQRTDRTAR